MKEIKHYKVKSLSGTLPPDSVFYVRETPTSDVKVYITSLSGVPVPIKDLTGGGSSGVQSVVNTDGTITITGSNNINIKISPSILAIINSALQAGDNISSLINDAGYLTASDLPSTKSEFNSQLSDGDFLFVGDVINYTNEEAQDAVGNILTDSVNIEFIYTDGTPEITANVKADSITANELSPGINISEFTNDVGYLEQADLADTKAEFNSQLSDGDFLFVGDVTQYTDEMAQDAVGNNLLDTSTIDLSYNDVTGQISAEVQANSITENELSNTINVSEFINDSSYANETYVDNKIVQTISNGDTTHAPSSDVIFDALSSKEDSLGYTPEDVVNKTTTMTGNETSNILYLTAKAVYDWAIGLFVPKTRTITINGTTQDLSADRTYTVTTGTTTTVTNITSSSLTTQDATGFVAYINALVSSFAVAANEERWFQVTDTGQKFLLLLNNRSFGGAEADITVSDVLVFEDEAYFTDAKIIGAMYAVPNTLQNPIGAGMTTSATADDSGTGPTFAGNSFLQWLRRRYASASTAGSSILFVNTSFRQIKNVTDTAFQVFMHVGNEDAATVATSRNFFGFLGATSVGNVEPSSLMNMFALANDSGDANYSIMHNDASGTATKVSLGASFPAQTVSIDHYAFTYWKYKGSSSIYYKVTNLHSGAEAKGVVTTNLPASGGYFTAMNRNNGSTASIVRLSVSHHIIKEKL